MLFKNTPLKIGVPIKYFDVGKSIIQIERIQYY